MVFNLVMIFTSIFIVLYVSSIAYSKGFKIRNRIIDIVEKTDGWSDKTREYIDADLAAIGYPIRTSGECKNRESGDGGSENSLVSTGSAYNYCIYQYYTPKGDYYGVTVFIKFDFPLIKDVLQIPIYGETRILFDKDRVEN